MSQRYQVIHYGLYFCDLIFTGLPKMPALGEEYYGSGLEIRPGANFNPALAFQRLGVRAGWVCDFGNDFFSRYVLERCREEGIDPGLFEILPLSPAAGDRCPIFPTGPLVYQLYGPESSAAALLRSSCGNGRSGCTFPTFTWVKDTRIFSRPPARPA